MASPQAAFARVRTLCLDLPETSEVSSWGHPNFKVRRKAFVAFETVKERPSIAFRAAPADVARLLERPQFFETPYGRGLWASVWVDRPVAARLLQELTLESYRLVAGKRLSALLDSTARVRR
jgi:predicted DNA-binding protein (MmcQ/YjbR family)